MQEAYMFPAKVSYKIYLLMQCSGNMLLTKVPESFLQNVLMNLLHM